MRIPHRITVFLLVLILGATSFAQVVTDPLTAEQPALAKKSPWGAIITIGLISVAAGTGGYFLYRRGVKDRQHGDSIIAVVENAWQSASQLYAQERYRDAIVKLQEITAVWHEYDRYSGKYRRRHMVNPDTIRAVIASCDFLETMIEPVRTLTDYAETLPVDEYALTKMTRHDLDARRRFLKTSIDSILEVNPNHRSALHYSFRIIERRLHTVDSLVDAAYFQQKTDFEVKNRFYYNRAVESNDTTELRRFVENCEFYRVDKEWCQRARMALGQPASTGTDDGFAGKTMSVKDSIEYAFERTIGSKKIEDLEQYLEKYSSRRYRRYSRLTRINEIKAALRLLKTAVEQQVAFNRAYPRLDARNVGNVTVIYKGVSSATEGVFENVWKSLEHELARIPQIRHPVSLTVDYTGEPPVIQFEAVIDPATDISRNLINERATYKIECLVPAVRLLHSLKTGVVARLQRAEVDQSEEQVIQYQVKKVEYVAYTVRLNKPDNGGMIMFYARARRATTLDSLHQTEFYDFYDISVPGYQAKRFSIYPTSLPNIIPSLSSDTLEQVMGERFFGTP